MLASQLTRRGFLTAGATLAALAGREPQLVRAAAPAATADAVIVLWMAGGMAQTETFDPKRYTPFAPGVRTEQVLSTFPGDRHRGRPHQVFAGPGARRPRDGSRRDHPHVPGGGPRLHPALAASVPLAYRLHPAADGRDAAHRRGGREDARAEEPDGPGVRRDRAGSGDRRGEPGAEVVPHGGIPRGRIRPVPDQGPAGRRFRRAAAGRTRRAAVPEPPPSVRAAPFARARLPARRAIFSASR